MDLTSVKGFRPPKEKKMDLKSAIQMVARKLAYEDYMLILEGTGKGRLSMGEVLAAVFGGEPKEIEDEIHGKALEIELDLIKEERKE